MVSIWRHYSNSSLDQPILPGQSCSYATDEPESAIEVLCKLLAKTDLSERQIKNRLVAVAWTPWRDIALPIEPNLMDELVSATKDAREKLETLDDRAQP